MLVPVTRGHSALCVCSECLREVRSAATTPLPFPGGGHVPARPTIEHLRQSARDWMALAAGHNQAATDAIDAGDDATGAIELAHAERKTEMARIALLEARAVAAGTL